MTARGRAAGSDRRGEVGGSASGGLKNGPTALGLDRRSAQNSGLEPIEQPHRLRIARVLKQDRTAGPVRVRWAGAMHEQRLVDPGAAVGESRSPTGAAPADGIVAAERPASVDVS